MYPIPIGLSFDCSSSSLFSVYISLSYSIHSFLFLHHSYAVKSYFKASTDLPFSSKFICPNVKLKQLSDCLPSHLKINLSQRDNTPPSKPGFPQVFTSSVNETNIKLVTQSKIGGPFIIIIFSSLCLYFSKSYLTTPKISELLYFILFLPLPN